MSRTEQHARRPRRWWRRILTWLIWVCVASILVVCAAIGWVQWSESKNIYDADSVPKRPVALVLGAGLSSDGTPSPYLARRLQIALDLYQSGQVEAILVSGDNSTPWHDEPTAMSDWLVQRGVPSADITLDHAGLDTHDSCVRAHDVFDVSAATVITQDYHLPRALFSCSHAGIDVVGVAASSADGEVGKYRLRELAASVKAAWDVVFDRSARFPQ